jgi:hypothetical protein
MRWGAWVALGILLLAGPGLIASVRGASTTPGPGQGVALTLTSGGALTASFSIVDPNGSALRYAMDGNFTPLILSLPLSATNRTLALTEISTLEAEPLLSGLFGNRDGSVEADEVTNFAHLLEVGSRDVPGTLLTGVDGFNATLDGQAPSSVVLSSITFANATGADTSSLPLTIESDLAAQFGAVGSPSVLALDLPVSTLPTGIPVGLLSVPVSFAGPAATTITSVSGLVGESTTNDPLGWAAPSAQGNYPLGSPSAIQFHFEAAFPVGDVLVIGLSIVALVIAVALLARRRRRRRLARIMIPPGGLGPSGSA